MKGKGLIYKAIVMHFLYGGRWLYQYNQDDLEVHCIIMEYKGLDGKFTLFPVI